MTELTPERLADYESAMARLPYSSPMLVDYDALQAFITAARERDELKEELDMLQSTVQEKGYSRTLHETLKAEQDALKSRVKNLEESNLEVMKIRDALMAERDALKAHIAELRDALTQAEAAHGQFAPQLLQLRAAFARTPEQSLAEKEAEE